MISSSRKKQSRGFSNASLRPAWNSYITDDSQYKLNQQQQLQKRLQILASPHRRTRGQSPLMRRPMPINTGIGGIKKRPLNRNLNSNPKQSTELMQDEFTTLENMISQLETETASYDMKESEETGEDHNSSDVEDHIEQEDTSSTIFQKKQDDTLRLNTPDFNTMQRLCHKSIELSLTLSQRVDNLTTELENEQNKRKEQENRQLQLEQKCQLLEQKLATMDARWESMREAIITTEEAIVRLVDIHSQPQSNLEESSGNLKASMFNKSYDKQ